MSEFVINLVFDNFDNTGKPIPNGFDNSLLIASFPNWISGFPEIKTKYSNVDNVLDDGTFYYIINYGADLKQVIYDNFIISQKAIKACKHKNLKIIFANHHEANHDELDALTQIIRYIKDFNLNESNFYYITNNGRLDEYKKSLKTQMNIQTSLFLFELVGEHMNSHLSIFKEKKEFLFSCHNRILKKHRLETLCFLKKHNILKNTDWSNLNSEITTYSDHTRVGLYPDEIDFFKRKGLKYSKYEIDKTEWLDKEYAGGIVTKITPECFTNCYINIITETYFDSLEIHASEKSFRAFYFMQLPIFIATYGHVGYLRKKFGFDMFDDLIDHSYDLEINSEKRMKMVFEEIKRLNNNKDLVIDFYKNNKHRFEKNLALFQTKYKNKKNINLIKNLLTHNVNEDDNLHLNDNGITQVKIFDDVIVPNKCGTRYIEEYFSSNADKPDDDKYYNNSMDIKGIWGFPELKWIIIRHPTEYFQSAIKTDLIDNWNKNDISELDLINKYLSYGTSHYFNNLYKTLYSYSLNYKNVTFVNLEDLTDFCSHMFINKKNIKYDSIKYNMMGRYYMNQETILDYVKEFYPSQWDIIQINLKKEIFFYNEMVSNCNFFNKIDYPPVTFNNNIVVPAKINNDIIAPVKINDDIVIEVIEKNSWLRKIV
jgi:hypothetical protein